MKLRIVIDASNDVDMKDAVEQMHLSEEEILNLYKALWQLALNKPTNGLHNDVINIVSIEKLSDI